jgi:hypothetical protein
MGSLINEIVREDFFVVEGQWTRPVFHRENSDILGIALSPGPPFGLGKIDRGDRMEAGVAAGV